MDDLDLDKIKQDNPEAYPIVIFLLNTILGLKESGFCQESFLEFCKHTWVAADKTSVPALRELVAKHMIECIARKITN